MCVAFTASPTSFVGSGTTTLSWDTENATDVSISGIGSVAADGSRTVTVTSTTTYTLTASGIGSGDDCDVTVTVTPTVEPPPVCTLSANIHSFVGSGTTTLSWTTSNANNVSISGIGAVAANGSTPATLNSTTTYTLTATGPGGSVNCSDTVTITNPPGTPACTLSAAVHSFVGAGSTTLSWTTSNATSVSIDQGIGAVAASGSTPITVNATTTYTLTATGPGGTVNCSDTVTITPVTDNAPMCVSLDAAPSSIRPGESTTLTWVTRNATSVSLSGVGAVAANDSRVVTPVGTTTYTLTVNGTGPTSNCSVTVTVTNNPVPACVFLRASDSSIEEGEAVTLSWETDNATSFELNQGIGRVPSGDVDAGTYVVYPDNDITYVGTAGGAGASDDCEVSINVDDDNGGGGGGGSRRSKPDVTLLKEAPEEPLSYVYLSQIPYTGLDLGPVGTVIYWLALVIWSLALAYLFMFKMLPYLRNRSRQFGMNVHYAMNNEGHGHNDGMHAAMAHNTHAPSRTVTAHYSQNVEPVQFAHTEAIVDAPRGFSTYDGFRSFGSDSALTIDDIVKGLTRQPVQVAPAPEVRHEEVVAPVAHVAEARHQVYKDVPTDVRGFIAGLIQGDRDGVFAILRNVVRGGGDVQAFVTSVVCGLDDAYRARLDGSVVDPEVARAVANVATPTLERVIASLTTAIDSSYSLDVTGAKLAVTRALAVLGA